MRTIKTMAKILIVDDIAMCSIKIYKSHVTRKD